MITKLMTRTVGFKTLSAMAACAAAVAAAGCGSDTVAGHPTTESAAPTSTAVPQPDLLKDFVAERDPMNVFKGGIYNILREPMGPWGPCWGPPGSPPAACQSVPITGYRHTIAADGTTAKTTTFVFNPVSNSWEPIADLEIVWSPSQAKWVKSDLTETLSPGPAGSRGWPTVKSVSDAGTSYDTVSYQELGGKALPDGLEKGFAAGGQLPRSALAGKFSPGARGYVRTTTTIDPTYTVRHITDANTHTDTVMPVYACGKPTPDCKTAATSLEMAAQQGGQFTNVSGTARLELGADGKATLRPVDVDIPFANLTYRIVDNDGPRRIVFQASNPDDADKFAQAIDTLDTFALYEYDGQVVVGLAQPANTTNTYFAGYNQTAANDLVTQWTPALPAVLP